jgi:hypothetical protein
MNCADCNEVITEIERKGMFHCYKCDGPMHGECAMIGASASSLCENCYYQENTEFIIKMKGKSNVVSIKNARKSVDAERSVWEKSLFAGGEGGGRDSGVFDMGGGYEGGNTSDPSAA